MTDRKLLADMACRIVAADLAGFAAHPTPVELATYAVDVAREILAQVDALHPKPLTHQELWALTRDMTTK